MANPQEKHPGLSVPFYLTVKAGTPQALLGLSPGGSMVLGLRRLSLPLPPPWEEVLFPVADGPCLNTASLGSGWNGNYLKLAQVCTLHWVLFHPTLSCSLGTA